MIQCIICGECAESSIEHIIPEALGNRTLKTDLVCKKCNNELGRTADSFLSNAPPIIMLRRLLNISPSKNGSIPLPFNKLPTNSKVIQNMILSPTGNSKIRMDIQPQASRDSLHIIACNKKAALDIVEKWVNRGLPEKLGDEVRKEIASQPLSAIQYIFKPISQLNNSSSILEIGLPDNPDYIDEIGVFIGILKIAYEFTFCKLGAKYLSDSMGKEIQTILHSLVLNNEYRSSDVYKYVFCNALIDDFSYENLKLTAKPEHMAFLFGSSDKLVFSISLFDIFQFIVLVSANNNDYRIEFEYENINASVDSN